jgi:hypothetical protein
MMPDNFKLLMIGAMNENGGNVTHRLLDGHPGMYVYPFESQLGTKLVDDHLTSLFPIKYRWPVFPLNGTVREDYKLIIDEEVKVRSRTPGASKFQSVDFRFSDDERRAIYEKLVKKEGRSRAGNVRAFFKSTFEAWGNYRTSGYEKYYVGYSPVSVIDAEKIFADFPRAHFLHVVRNPWSAYTDTKKRPVPLSLADYTLCWNINQYFALLFRQKYTRRMHILRLEDILANPYKTLGGLCGKLGLKPDNSLRKPSWNKEELDEVSPWGVVQKATVEYNIRAANKLSKEERKEIGLRTGPYISEFKYGNIFKR